jgi:hypothetical protein
MTHDKSLTNVVSQPDKSHPDLFLSITKPILTNPVRIPDCL